MLMRRPIAIALLSLSMGSMAAVCPNTDFDEHYAPSVRVPDPQTYCYAQYTLTYDLGLKSAIWVGEHLGKGEQYIHERKNTFAPNMEIPEPSRTTMKDYKEPIYDQGHMASAGDMVDQESQRESFLMSNMVPQTAHLNRGIWKHLEDHLRKLSATDDLMVITGPIYDKANLDFIGNRVPIPVYTFKWVYDLTNKTEYGYAMQNVLEFPSKNVEDYRVTKEWVEKNAGILLK